MFKTCEIIHETTEQVYAVGPDPEVIDLSEIRAEALKVVRTNTPVSEEELQNVAKYIHSMVEEYGPYLYKGGSRGIVKDVDISVSTTYYLITEEYSSPSKYESAVLKYLMYGSLMRLPGSVPEQFENNPNVVALLTLDR